MVLALLCALVEQGNDKQPQQCKRNIAVNSPGKGSVAAQPLVLREQAQGDTKRSQQVYKDGCIFLPLCMVAQPPCIVKDDIKNSHSNGSDKFPSPKGRRKIFKPCGAEG